MDVCCLFCVCSFTWWVVALVFWFLEVFVCCLVCLLVCLFFVCLLLVVCDLYYCLSWWHLQGFNSRSHFTRILLLELLFVFRWFYLIAFVARCLNWLIFCLIALDFVFGFMWDFYNYLFCDDCSELYCLLLYFVYACLV